MLTPTLPGWKVESVGDDIAWMRFGPDGRLICDQSRSGFFWRCSRNLYESNPNAMRTIRKQYHFYQRRSDR